VSPSPKRPRKKGIVHEKSGSLVAGTAVQGKADQWGHIFARIRRTFDKETGNIVTVDEETGDVTVTVGAASSRASAGHGATETVARDGGVVTTIQRLASWAESKTKRGRGRPAKTDEHRQWAEVFQRLRDELNGDFESINGEPPLNNMELCRLVIDELGLSVTNRAVWDAVKRRL
jgi:hypothetical protein